VLWTPIAATSWHTITLLFWLYCTGGSRGAGGSLLLKLHELLEAEDRLAAHQARLAQIEQQLRQLEPLGRQYRK
jgi:hypothetical protein